MSFVLNRDSNSMTIAMLWENIQRKKFNFNPKYQRRDSVWDDEKQSFLIDSILRNFPIPPIFLHQHIDAKDGSTKYDVIDGKQRLTSIRRFIENEIPVSSENVLGGSEEDEIICGKLFEDFSDDALLPWKMSFWRYPVSIEYIDTMDEQIVNHIFDRLNRNGEPLNGQELRNAKYCDSELIKVLFKLAKIPFWEERLLHTDKQRMQDLEFLSELLFALITDGPEDGIDSVIDQRYDNLSKAEIDWVKLQKNFEIVTDYMKSLNLNYEEYKIKGVSHLYGIWTLCLRCISKDISAARISNKLEDFFAILRSRKSECVGVEGYKRSMSSRTRSFSRRKERVEALALYLGI